MNPRSTVFMLVLALALRPSASRAQTTAARAVSAPAQLAPDLAFADPTDPNPGSGKRKIVAGWASFGFATAMFAQLPLCARSHFEGPFQEQTCVRLSAGLAATALSLSLPLLVYGYRQRARQTAWKRRHGLRARLQCRPVAGGGVLSYDMPF